MGFYQITDAHAEETVMGFSTLLINVFHFISESPVPLIKG